MRSGTHVNHGYNNEFLDSDRVANVYFTSDVDAKNRIRSFNEFSKINLNAIRRAGMHDDGVFNDCELSDQESDDEIASIDCQTNAMNHSASSDIIDSQLNSKDNEDNDNDDD